MALLDDINEKLRDFTGWDASNPLPIGDPRTGVHDISKADLRNLLRAIAQTMGDPSALQEIISGLDAKADLADSGKIFPDRATAVSKGQENLPAAIGRIITMENEHLVLRGQGMEDDDPLFPTAPRWGVLLRVPSTAILDTKSELAFAGKMFGQRSSAVNLGQARLPEDLGLIATREGAYLAIRAPLVTADDPLFETAPQWGVVARLPDTELLDTKAELAFAGKMFGMRSSAVTLGQERLPENLGLIATREGNYVAIRAPLVTADDPLFETAPQWGVIDRLPSKALLDAVGVSEGLGVSPAVNQASTIPDRQWVAERKISQAGTLYQIEVHARIAGEMEVAVFSESGSNLIKGERRTVFLSAGHNRIILDSEIPIAAGQRIGWWATPGLVSATDGAAGGMDGYHRPSDTSSGKLNTVPFGTPYSANIRFSVAFAVRSGGNSGALGLAIEAFKTAQQGGDGNSATWPDTTSYLLVWAVGQSNGAGRGTDPSEFSIEPGRGFKYDPSDGIVHLIEPTGTDSLAQSNNYTSFGSGLAAGMLAATAGRVGVIVVNSCVGATTIADWAAGTAAWTNAQAQLAAALSGINAARLNVVGAVSVFCQGEGDVSTAPATYKAGVSDLLSRMRVEASLPRMKMMIVQTGTHNAGDTTGFQAIRQAQTELANDSDGSIIMAHAGARHFPARGLMLDDLHYTTQGYDEIGSALGAAAAAHGIGLRVPALDS